LIFGLDNISHEKRVKADIGFVIDECCLHGCLKADEISKIMKPVYPRWYEGTFKTLLDKFGISRNKKVAEMSKGTKSKLMLAIAMAHDPRLLILDEVTTGLDPVMRDDVLKSLKDYQETRQATVFFSTDITSDLEKIADDIAFLHDGRLVFYESLELEKLLLGIEVQGT
jgi:ABC-2 type transport system ATP-binding protein